MHHDRPDAANDPGIDEIVEAFRRTPEIIEKEQFLAALHAARDTGPPIKITVSVDPIFAEMWKFLDSKGVFADGTRRSTFRKYINAAAVDFCFAERSQLSSDELQYPFYREVWNRVCDEMGRPGAKIVDAPLIPPMNDDVPF